MGLLDGMFSSFTGQENGQQSGSNFLDIMQYGLVGASVKNNMAKKQNEAAAREKPGVLCIPTCSITDDFCNECLQGQKDFLGSMSELQDLEKSIDDFNNNPQAAAPEKPSKCSLCGAPFEDGERACPYCDTPYPETAFAPEIPVTRPEQQQLLLKKAAYTYKLYSDWFNKRGNKQMSGMSGGIIGGFAKMIGSGISGAMAMDQTQLRQGAQHYKVSYSEYISGIISGQYQTVGAMQMQQQAEALEEQRRQREQMQAQKQAQRQAQFQSQQQTSNGGSKPLDLIRKHNDMSSGTGYVGGPTMCCGNCKYYGAGKCCATGARFEGWNRNASDDTCGWYSMKL